MTTQTKIIKTILFDKDSTCEERVKVMWNSRKVDFQKFIAEENYDDLSDYILDVSHVDAQPADSSEGKHLQHAPYDRIQISYGGPTEEIRFITGYDEDARDFEDYFKKDIY